MNEKSFYDNVVGELAPLRDSYHPIPLGDIRTISDEEWAQHWRQHGSGWRNPSLENDYYLERAYGGSDMGVIMGVSHFKSRLDLFADKTNQKLFRRFGNTDALELGHIYETPTAKKYHSILRKNGKYSVTVYVEGRIYKPNGEIVRKANGDEMDNASSMQMYRDGRKDKNGKFLYPWALANCDGIIVDVIEGKPVTGILEIKTTSPRNISVIEDWKNGHIPEAYYYQIVYYMAILNVQFCDICCSWGQTFEDTAIVRIYRNYEQEEKLFAAVSEFDDYVAQGIEPDPGFDQPELLLNYYYEKFGPATEQSPMVELPESFRSIITEAMSIDDEIKKAQEAVKIAEFKKAEIYAKLYPAFGNAMYGRFKWSDEESIAVTLKTPTKRAKFDTERFEKEHPIEYAQCMVFSPSELAAMEKKLKQQYMLPAEPNTEDRDKLPSFVLKMKKNSIKR